MKRLLFAITLLASHGYAACTVSDVLPQIRPGEEWTLRNNDPSTLVWISPTVPPTLAEINAGLADCPNQTNLKQRSDALNELLTGTSDRDKLNRGILLTILDQVNILRTNAGLSTITSAQVKTAVQQKINSGSAD